MLGGAIAVWGIWDAMAFWDDGSAIAVLRMWGAILLGCGDAAIAVWDVGSAIAKIDFIYKLPNNSN